MKFRSKFNRGFTNRGCLHSAILKAHRARDMQFFLENVQNKIFKILNMKFTREACYSNSKIETDKMQQRRKHHTQDILILSLLLVIIMV